MLKTDSFTYTISSLQIVERTPSFAEGVFVFDALPQSEYFVQCTAFIVAQTGLVNPPYIINLVSTDFTRYRTYNAGNYLLTNQLVLATIPTSVNSGTNLQSGEGSVFRVSGMNLQKRVTFALYDSSLDKITDAIAPWDAAFWVVTFQFTPI